MTRITSRAFNGRLQTLSGCPYPRQIPSVLAHLGDIFPTSFIQAQANLDLRDATRLRGNGT